MAEKWSVFYTQRAIDFIIDNVDSERVANKIFKYRELLESMPDLGRFYDPEYPAARPPFPCRCIAVSDTPFAIYYIKEEEARRVVIFCIEYQRVDPHARFSNINWQTVPW